MKKTILLLVLAHLGQAATAATPAERERFAEPGSQLVSVDTADLNGDGSKDYVSILRRNGIESPGRGWPLT